MRRGHPGIGGWRSENPRHFRSRGSGPPRFRPPRIYPLIETPRFPPPSTRLHHRGPQPFIGHANHPEDLGRQDHHDRHKYRDDHHQINQRMPERGHHSRRAFPYMHHNIRQTENSQYNNSSNFYDDVQTETYQVNSMGDIDHRQTPHMQHAHESYNQQRITQWSNPPPEIKKHYYEHRSPQKSFRHHDAPEANRIPLLDYTGHRPPSSDHYGGTTGPTTNNNDTSFSRSVDDTVDIIRKRLMNRSDPSRLSQDASIQESLDREQEVHEISHQHTQQEQPAKKRTPRQRHNDKTNCDKMKTNIVHQLFKMDKDKMHKLMDNPSSSSKFEYAISSLITESQNSLNRHLRAVAEKSLHHSSTDFIQNDNNTIYEDIFMKQMQCILDPQDTVLLEDIKPIVMAELSKVLQLDELEQRYDMPDEHNNQHTRDDQSIYQYFEPYNYDEYAHTNYEQVPSSSSNLDDTNRVDVTDSTNINYDYDNETAHEETKLLFERRQQKITEPSENRRHSIERQRRRKEQPAEEVFKTEVELPSFFDSNTDQLSEVDDTFAELDRQYHVAVDPNFIENDDLTARGTPPKSQSIPESPHIKKEINNQLKSAIKSPLNLFPANSSIDQLRDIAVQIKKELSHSPHIPNDHGTATSTNKDTHHVGRLEIRQEYAPKSKETDKETEKSGSSSTIKISPSNSRKRSIDQRPPHRKEKRKKRESSSSSHHDSIKQTADKKSLTRDYNSKSSEKCNDAPKPYNNIFLHRDESTKESRDNRKSYSADRRYSDKYVRRKEPSKRSKDKECESGRKRHSSTSSQTILSPKDNNNTTSQTPTKTDPKTKLKTFDMFVEQPKKSVMPHQAHRNTAAAVTPTKPMVEENKPQLVPTPVHNVQTKHVGTQVIKRLLTKETQTSLSKSCSTRFCQTDRKKLITKMVQTSPVSLGNSKPKATDAFERMKEIDMEIQVLLQEKFKLYSSLEAKDSCPSSMPTLGMTVLNVTPVDETETKDDIAAPLPENIMNADEIIDDFTSIPVEELEQIALETVTVNEDSSADAAKIEKRSLRQKVMQQERKTSESPTSRKRNNKKGKPPNISLIEQIITDDRPLEDIISLDDLEAPPTRNRKKPNIKQDTRKSHTKKKTKRTKPAACSIDISSYGLKKCLVVLDPNDVKKFIKESSPLSENIVKVTPGPSSADSVETVSTESLEKAITSEVEEVVNDLQFDMLDVSEDIVIGDNCEIKSNDDKDGPERVPISEDIILDNSQSSADEAISAEGAQAESECRTYDYSTDEKLRRDSVTVTGNADAVLAIECIENDFIAACLDGNVYHFSGDGLLLNTLRGSNLAVTCLTIVKENHGTTVYTGSLDSRIRYYDLSTGYEKGPECNVLSPIQTMDRAWDTVFVGTRTGFVLQFECKNNMLIPVSTVKFSEQSILALRAMKEGPRKVLLVAARSEDVTIKDAQTGLLLRTLCGPKMTVYTLLFEDGKVFCGTSSHQIHVFDYSSGMHTGCHEGGKGAVCLRASGGLLFAGCYDGCVYVYREGETRPLAQLRGPSLMLLSLAIVGSKIIAGYKDRSLYIWKIPLSILQEMIL